MTRPRVAIVHDYLTQRGGAERVVLSMARAFPDATIHTSLYDPAGTFPAFEELRVATMPIDRVGALRRDHRRALPLLATSFSRTTVDADVCLCSSSGWAHGVRTTGAKVVYCHAPARWLWQQEAYLADAGTGTRLAMRAATPALVRWDRAAAASADAYLANSTHTRRMVADAYGIDAAVVHPPAGLDRRTEPTPVEGVAPGHLLVVSRLLPYKNVDAVIGALELLPGERLVVVGSGPDLARLREQAAATGAPVRFLPWVSDGELAWLYEHAAALVTASYEDFGLTPLEAAAAGIPTAALRFGGFLDTVVEGTTGVHFDEPTASSIAAAIVRLRATTWSTAAITAHAATFDEPTFHAALRAAIEQRIPT